jgi:hypothetical protein
MSDHESDIINDLSETIARQSSIMRWVLGGIAAMLMGAVGVGMWLARQESALMTLTEADKQSVADRAEIKGMVNVHSTAINSLSKDTALQNRDLLYIRERVTEIATELKQRTQ